MLATLYLERDPLKLTDIGNGLATWAQDAGGFALALLLGLMLWSLSRWKRGLTHWLWGDNPSMGLAPLLFRVGMYATLGGYLVAGLLVAPDLFAAPQPPEVAEVEAQPQSLGDALRPYGDILLTIAGACALFTVSLPMLVNLLAVRWRRIWAIARLSFKEALRRKVLYVFSALLVVFLFLGWFVSSKPEDQLHTYVVVVFTAMTPLILVSAALLSAFGIPTDIKQQTIHTVVTKPVEKVEVVLGRIVGYTLLMSLVLLIMTTLSLGYVLRGVNPDAAAESLKARVPLYGNLDFEKTQNEHTDREITVQARGDNVGREWDYHKYIGGKSLTRTRADADAAIHYAVWSFPDIPSALGRNDSIVRGEFKFDIYRTNKGKENEGVFCSFFLQTRYFDKPAGARQKFLDKRDQLQREGKLDAKAENELAEEFGYWEIQGKAISDYHTLHVDIPVGLFKNAISGPPGGGQAVAGAPALLVRVRCESESQFVGMARYDLYFRQDSTQGGPDRIGFALNFYKAALGLWMSMVLIITLNVCLSTELSGIISFLCVKFLYLGGWGRDFIQELAERKNVGGGPLESFFRLVNRENLVTPLEETTITRVATGSDEAFRWFVRRFLNVLPDAERFSFTEQVANGFNIGVVAQDLLPMFLILLGYLLPWFLLAYYQMKAREIAGPN